MIKTLILGDTKGEISKLENLITDSEFTVEGLSTNLTNVSDEISFYNPDMVIMYCSDMSWIFRACKQIYLLYPNVVTVMVSDEISYDIAKKAIDSGVTGYVSPIPESNQLCEELKRIYFDEKSRISMLMEKSLTKRNAEVITLFSTKGGVGKTTVATNLAVELSRKNQRVIIVDLDLLFGDVNIFLGLDLKETIVELLQEQKVPTFDSIRKYFVLHSSGVQVLCAPSSPEYSENISASQIEPIMNILRANYDYIIVDTSIEFSELNLYLLEEANTILFLTGLDISLLNNSKKGLLLLDSLNLKDKTKVIVNRAFKGDISIFDVEKIMDKEVISVIPNDYTEAVRALNQGVPIVYGNSKSSISKEISSLSNQFNGMISKKSNKKSLFSKFSLKLPGIGGKK